LDRKIPYPISAKWLTRLLDRVGPPPEFFALKAYSHAADRVERRWHGGTLAIPSGLSPAVNSAGRETRRGEQPESARARACSRPRRDRARLCIWLRSLCSASSRRTLSCVFSASPPPVSKSMLRRWDGASEGARPTWPAGSARLATTYVSSALSAQTRWATISWPNSNSTVSIPSTRSVPMPPPRAPHPAR
jgi:hypothetical protein